MIRRLFLSIFAFALLGLSMTANAQSDPLPVPSEATTPTLPVERTAADLEAIRQMDEAAMRDAGSGFLAMGESVFCTGASRRDNRAGTRSRHRYAPGRGAAVECGKCAATVDAAQTGR